MGLPVARSRLPGDFPNTFLAPCLAFPLAVVPADVRIRRRQTSEPRPHLGQSDRPQLPLPNAASPDRARLVRRAGSALAHETLHRLGILHRRDRAISDIRTPNDETVCGGDDRTAA